MSVRLYTRIATTIAAVAVAVAATASYASAGFVEGQADRDPGEPGQPPRAGLDRLCPDDARQVPRLQNLREPSSTVYVPTR